MILLPLYCVYHKKTEKDISITDGIYDLGGIEYVNIVMQNDEISN